MGGHVGLMGRIADAALEAGGEVTGVIPQVLVDREKAHQGLSRLEVVPDMHTRKARFAQLSQGFIAPSRRDALVSAEQPAELIAKLRAWQSPHSQQR